MIRSSHPEIMALKNGSRLGHYFVTALIGEGGIGEGGMGDSGARHAAQSRRRSSTLRT